jgi:hypothetical protein
LALNAPVDCEPLTDLLPDQAPEAVQAVALVEDQVSAELAPRVIELGLALRETVGAGFLTDTDADCEALPPGPVQVSPKVELAVKSPVDWVPLRALSPDQLPEAAQEVALVDDHVIVALPPLTTALGPTLSVTVGIGDLTDTVADWTALPPGPVQLSEYVVLASTAPVDWEPLTALAPVQPPEALHAVAFFAAQVSVAPAPLLTVLGLAPMVTTGALELTDTVADCDARPPGPVQVST